MKIVYGVLDQNAKTVFIADQKKGWVLAAGYEFRMHNILFAAIPVAKDKQLYVIHVESGQLLFSPDMPKSVAKDPETLLDFIQEKAMVPTSIIIQKEGVDVIKAENVEYVKQSFDLFGKKPESEYLHEMDLSNLQNKKLNLN